MSYYNRYSDEYKDGKRKGEQAYSDYDYDRDKYYKYGTEEQRNYVGGFDQAREDKHYEERRREEREEEEREEERHQAQLAQERYQQDCYEQQMYEEQQQHEQEQQDERTS